MKGGAREAVLDGFALGRGSEASGPALPFETTADIPAGSEGPRAAARGERGAGGASGTAARPPGRPRQARASTRGPAGCARGFGFDGGGAVSRQGVAWFPEPTSTADRQGRVPFPPYERDVDMKGTWTPGSPTLLTHPLPPRPSPNRRTKATLSPPPRPTFPSSISRGPPSHPGLPGIPGLPSLSPVFRAIRAIRVRARCLLAGRSGRAVAARSPRRPRALPGGLAAPGGLDPLRTPRPPGPPAPNMAAGPPRAYPSPAARR